MPKQTVRLAQEEVNTTEWQEADLSVDADLVSEGDAPAVGQDDEVSPDETEHIEDNDETHDWDARADIDLQDVGPSFTPGRAADYKADSYDSSAIRLYIASLKSELLTPEREVELGKTIEKANRKKRLLGFSNDYVASMCLKVLEQIDSDSLRFDRHVEVGVMDGERVRELRETVRCNVGTIRSLLSKNRHLVALVMSKESTPDERAETLKALHRNRVEIAKLFIETRLRVKHVDRGLGMLEQCALEVTALRDKSTSADDTQARSRVIRSTLKMGESAETAFQRISGFQHAEAEASKAIEELVDYNRRLVVDIAKRYQNRGLCFEDLIQEGNLGLMRAAEKYDWKRGTRFSTYATWWIRQGVRRALSDKSRTIRMPVASGDVAQRIRVVEDNLEQSLQRPVSSEELHEHFNDLQSAKNSRQFSKDDFTAIRLAQQRMVSLDTPVDTGTLGYFIAERSSDYDSTPLERVIGEETRELSREALENLRKKNRLYAEVIEMRLGLCPEGPRTLQEIGAMYSLSKERIRQIETKAYAALKQVAFRMRLIEDFDRESQ